MSGKIHIHLLLLAVWCVHDIELATNKTPITRIVGGTVAPFGAIPYLVSVRHKANNGHFCGGTILADNWILTSADCIREKKPSDIIVVAGTNSRQRGCEIYNVDKFFIHPNFSRNPHKNDIALMRTEQTIKFSDKVQSITLPRDPTRFGEKSRLAGWGMTDQNGTQYDDQLHMLDVTITSMDQCRNNYYKGNVQYAITNSHLCTLTKAGEGACIGDLGGGLQLYGYVIGVLSWVTECARGKPDVFTRTHDYKDWIKKTMTDNNK